MLRCDGGWKNILKKCKLGIDKEKSKWYTIQVACESVSIAEKRNLKKFQKGIDKFGLAVI